MENDNTPTASAADRNTTADAPTPRTVFNRWWRTPLERHHGTPAESFFAALDAAGYDVVLRTPDTPTDSKPRYTPCPKCNDEQVICMHDGDIIGPCDCTELPVGDTAARARALLEHDYGSLCERHRSVISDLLAEVDRLTRWKAEATEVIGAWEAVDEALGCPAELGESRAAASEREALALRAERDAAVARADAAEAAIRVHHEAIWSEWSQTSRSIPPPADVALWAHVDIDPAARFAAERDRGTDR